MKKILALLAAVVTVLSLSQLPASASTTPLTGVTAIVGGGAHSCALINNGRVRCWGDNAHGELGGGAVGDSGRAVLVQNPDDTAPLTGVTQIASSYQGSCALLTTHEVVCWGANDSGQRGIGNTADQLPPPTYVLNTQGIGHLGGVRSVATSSDSTICAVLLTGQVRCWGANESGQTGSGVASPTEPFPVVVRSVSGPGRLTGVDSMDMGADHACARLTNGQVRCWGDNSYGQLGDGTVHERLRPVIVRKVTGPGPLGGVASLGLGDAHSCAILTSHQVRCWGDNTYGKLGNGNDDQRRRPTPVLNSAATASLGGVVSVSGGVGHTCARMATGQARCWGKDIQGQLGNGPAGASEVPVTVLNGAGASPLTDITRLTTGDNHTCAVIGGGAQCWGADDNGQLGDDSVTAGRPLSVVVVRG